MPRFCLFGILLFFASIVMAQSRGLVRICIVDSISREPVIGAVTSFEVAGRQPIYSTTNLRGQIKESLPYGNHRLIVTSLGYDSLQVAFRLSKPLLNLDTLRMKPCSKEIGTVVIEATAMRSSQRGDTLVYNASAFKTAFGADAGAMIQKMPGIELLDHGIEAQGRTIRQVYVDGREFFGTDVMAAIRNIPSDMILRIEVYNAQSDESEMAGIDLADGNMVLNIITRPDKRHGVVGRLYGSYGIKNKYIAGGNANIFHDKRRITLVGMVNNISKRNFSFENILGTADATGRSVGREFAIKEIPGISETQAFGVNYNDLLGKRGKITANYFFNRTDNHNENKTERINFSTTDRATGYKDRSTTDRIDLMHRFNSRIDYSFNKRHRVMIRLNMSATNNDQFVELFRRTDYQYTNGDQKFVNYRRHFTEQQSDYLQGSATISYSYRMKAKLLRSFNFSVSGTARKNNLHSDPHQYEFKTENEADELPDTTTWKGRSIRTIDRATPVYSYALSGSYTHGFSRRSRMNFSYRHHVTATDYDYTVFLLNNKTNQYPDERYNKQSSEYNYSYTTDRLGATFQYTRRKTRLAATLYYNHIAYRSRYIFPYETHTQASFNNITYSIVANIPLNKWNRIRINANSYTSNPSAGQLQAIVNTRDRQYVYAGNPYLEPRYIHRLMCNYVRTSSVKGRTFTLSLQYSYSPNSIEDSLVVDNPKFIIDNEGTELGNGNRYAKPINASGWYTLRLLATYGFPIRFLRSNLNIRADWSNNRRPSIINDLHTHLYNQYIAGTLTLSSNISENIDFTLSYMGRYQNNTTASRGMTLDNTFFQQRIRGDLTAVLGKRWVLRANGIYNSYHGITDDFHERRLILNAMAGVRVFKNRLGEVSVGVTDLLNENKSTFARWASGSALYTSSNLAIGRYYQLQFTYYLRHYRRMKLPIKPTGNTLQVGPKITPAGKI